MRSWALVAVMIVGGRLLRAGGIDHTLMTRILNVISRYATTLVGLLNEAILEIGGSGGGPPFDDMNAALLTVGSSSLRGSVACAAMTKLAVRDLSQNHRIFANNFQCAIC